MAYKIVYRGEPSVGDESTLRVEVVQVAHDEETGETYLQSRVRNAGETSVDGFDVTFSVHREDGTTHEVAVHQDGQLPPASTLDLSPVRLDFADISGVEATVVAASAPAPQSAAPAMPPLAELPVQPDSAPQPAAPAQPSGSVPGPLPVAPGADSAPAAEPEASAAQPAAASGMPPAPTAAPVADPAPTVAPGMPAAPVPGVTADAQPAQPKKKGSKGVIIAVIAIVALVAIIALGFSSCSGKGGGSGDSIGAGLSGPVVESDPDPVVGHWVLAGLEVDGEMYVEGNNATFDTSENYVDIDDDGTLTLMLNGERSYGTWELEEEMQDEQDKAEGLTYYSMTLLDSPFVAMVDSGDEPATLVAMATDMEGYSMYLVLD